MEPGNPNLLQLSPTVQATRSNYTRVHQGARRDVPGVLRRAAAAAGSSPTCCSPSTARGSTASATATWSSRSTDDVPLHDDFCWLTLGQISELLHQDNVVNMDARTVLACVPLPRDGGRRAAHRDAELLSWFTGERARHDVRARPHPAGRGRPAGGADETSVDHVDGQYFRVVAVSVQAGSREVTGWTPAAVRAGGARDHRVRDPRASTACRMCWRTPASRAASSTPSSSARPCSARPRTTPTSRRGPAAVPRPGARRPGGPCPVRGGALARRAAASSTRRAAT